MSEGWVEPSSIAAGEEIRRGVVDRQQDIQAQLGTQGLNEDGTFRYGEGEFEAWRQRAKTALKHANSDLRRINNWLAQKRREQHEREQQHETVDLRWPYEDLTTDEIRRAIQGLVNELVSRTFEEETEVQP